MSDAAVTREGSQNSSPGRDARVWSQSDHRPEGRRDHTGGSYYGRPIINLPTWQELDVAGYLFLGGLSGASSIVAFGSDLTGRPVLARRAKVAGSVTILASLGALVHDLGRPERFLHMLRVFKPTSPMSVGVWLLSAYSPLIVAAAGSDLLSLLPRVGRSAGAGAAVLGAGVATYTAALIADTAVPAWHEGHRELPFLFAGSAASAAAGFGLVAAPARENRPVRRLAAIAAAGELVAEQLYERRLGMVREALETEPARTRLRAAKALTVAGAVGAVASRGRLGAVASGAALVAASALTRFGIFAAGMESARDPRYTVQPQRERL